jgi:hypothetical protein
MPTARATRIDAPVLLPHRRRPAQLRDEVSMELRDMLEARIEATLIGPRPGK